MPSLKDINFGMNQWCGPSVLSAMTGKTTDECARVIQSINGQRHITAVAYQDILEAFRRLRFDVIDIKPQAYSLFGVIAQLQPGKYIIGVHRHVVAIEKEDQNKVWFVDNHSKQVINAGSSARLSQRVERVYRLERRKDPVLLEIKHQIQLGSRSLNIMRIEVYEDSRDNREVMCGWLQFQDSTELRDIVNELKDKVEEI